MLPEESPELCSGCGVYGSWPTSGEIDIMEAVNDMYTIYGTTHFGGPPGTMNSGYYNSWDNPLDKVSGWAGVPFPATMLTDCILSLHM